MRTLRTKVGLTIVVDNITNVSVVEDAENEITGLVVHSGANAVRIYEGTKERCDRMHEELLSFLQEDNILSLQVEGFGAWGVKRKKGASEDSQVYSDYETVSLEDFEGRNKVIDDLKSQIQESNDKYNELLSEHQNLKSTIRSAVANVESAFDEHSLDEPPEPEGGSVLESYGA